jgi:peptide/nickel transport system ATP-binding protein
MTSLPAPPGGDAALVEMRDIAKSFDASPPWLERMLARLPPARLHAVDGVSLSIRRGETLALVGESGCGKSTLARMTVGLIAPTRGSVSFDGVTLYGDGASTDAAALRRARASMQMIFQDPYASLNPRWRVADIVAEPIVAAEPRLSRAEVATRVRALLQQVGLASGDVHKFPHQFSGGQRQRISIARALSTHPAFIVCDEPTSALDVSVQAQVLNLMRDLQRRLGLAYLFISHNLAVVHHIADRVSVMYLGRIVESADTRRLFDAARHPYTQMLLDAVPDLHAPGGMPAAAVTTAAAIGEVPDALAQRSGCSFHPRCPFANARCRSEAPVLLRHDGGDAVACHGVEEKRIAPRASIAALARLAVMPGAAAAGIPL